MILLSENENFVHFDIEDELEYSDPIEEQKD